MFVVTEEWIESYKTKGGAWNKKQLAQIGVHWPPLAGWKARAVGRNISDAERQAFEAHSRNPAITVSEEISEEKVLDIYAFDDLIDNYQDAVREGCSQERINGRRALKDAYRAALRAAGKDDR